MIEQLNRIAAAWAETFAPMVVQNTVFLLLVLALLYLLRKAPARIRYIVGMIGMAKLLLPPFLPLPAILSSSPVTAPLGGSGPFLAFTHSSPPTAAAAAPALSVMAVLFTVWGAAALVYLATCSLSTLFLLRSLRGSVLLSDRESLALLKHEGIGVFRSNRISMPMTVGLFPRRILVPPAWEEWTAGRRQMVIRHEWAHIRRMDGLFRVVQIAAQALYFFHPLVHLLSRRVSDYREMACDDISTREERNASVEYSRFLVEIAEAMVQRPAGWRSASALIRRKNELLRRVRYQIREGGLKPMSRTRISVLLAGLLLLALPFSFYSGTSRSEVIAGEKKGHWSGEKAAPATATLRMEKEGELHFNGIPVGVADLRQALDEFAKKGGADAVLRIQCGDDVDMITVYKIHKLLAERSLQNVIYDGGAPGGLPLVLPSGDLQEKLVQISKENKENVAAVTVDGAGQVLLDGKPIPVEKMAKILTLRLKENEKLVVSLATENGTSYGEFVHVLGWIQKAGAERIALIPPKGAGKA